MTTQILRTEIYENIDGVTVLKEIIETETQIPTIEDEIADKEAQLLAMYTELQTLKDRI